MDVGEGTAVSVGEGTAVGVGKGTAVGVGEGTAVGVVEGAVVGVVEGAAAGVGEGAVVGVGEWAVVGVEVDGGVRVGSACVHPRSASINSDKVTTQDLAIRISALYQCSYRHAILPDSGYADRIILGRSHKHTWHRAW